MSDKTQDVYERMAAVACGGKGQDNCRHAWSAAHPEDQVTEAEQRAFEQRVEGAAGSRNRGDHLS